MIATIGSLAHILLPYAGEFAAACGGALLGGAGTYLALRWPRLHFVNLGDPAARGNRHGQAYWVADPYGCPIPDYDLRTDQYLVAHAAPMNDPQFDKSFRSIAPDGEVLVHEVTCDVARRAAQRHFVRRWVQATLPVPVAARRRAPSDTLDLPDPVSADPTQYEDDIQF
jgi:hypothetical protein